MQNLFHSAQDPVSCGTHAAGAVLALLGGFAFLLRAPDSSLTLGAAMCFCLSMIALYSASAVYHYYPGTADSPGVKKVLRKLDHSMIYVLIAGSYTPFSLALLPEGEGATFCLVLWAIAIVGILVKMFWMNAPRILSTAAYLAMGWSIVFVIRDFVITDPACLALIVAGGICYSVGAVFYALKKPNLSRAWTFHELFHVLILAGSFFHYLAVYFYVL
ncbi:MAG: hemolysin III family protein [Oscillospiraceae bacterium]